MKGGASRHPHDAFGGRSLLARNIVANLGGQLALLIIAVLAAKLVYGRLGADALGLVLFVQTINVVLAGVLDLGVPSITIREVAAHATDDPDYVRDLVRTASTVYWAAFLVVAAALVLTAPWIAAHWIHLRSMSTAAATTVIQYLGVAALTLLPRMLYLSICRGLQRMLVNNAIDAVTSFAQQLGIVIILLSGGSLFSVVAWIAVTYLIAVAAYGVAIATELSPLALIPGWSGAVIRRNARFSGHMMLISGLTVAHSYIDRLTVSKLLSAASLGWYTFASSFVARGALLTNAIADAALPAFAELFRQGRRDAMAAQYWKLHDLVSFLTVPLYAGAIYISLPLFTALFGRSAANTLLLPVAILAAGYYANGTLSVLYVYSLAMGKPELTSRFSLGAVLITVPLTVVAVARLGLAGASLGFLAYHLLFYAVAIPAYCRACPGIPVARWYRQLLAVVGLAAATYGLAWIPAAAFGLSLASLSVTYLVATTLFALVAIRMIGPELREAVTLLLGRPGPRLSHAA